MTSKIRLFVSKSELRLRCDLSVGHQKCSASCVTTLQKHEGLLMCVYVPERQCFLPCRVEVWPEEGQSLGLSIVGGRHVIKRLRNGEELKGIFIKQVLANSAAAKTQCLKTGDKILEVGLGLTPGAASSGYTLNSPVGVTRMFFVTSVPQVKVRRLTFVCFSKLTTSAALLSIIYNDGI